MLAVLNSEVPFYKYHRLSHFDPTLNVEYGRLIDEKELNWRAHPVLDDYELKNVKK